MKKIFSIATVSLVVLLLFAPVATSSMAGHGGSRWERPPDSTEEIDGNRRVIQYKVWDTGMTLFSAGRDHDRFNVYYFTLNVDKGAFMHFSYIRGPGSEQAERFHENVTSHRSFPENGHPPPPAAGGWRKEFSFKDVGFSILMTKLREFNETENDISDYRFGEVDFERPAVEPISEDGKTVGVRITTATTDGIFGLTFYIVSTTAHGQQKPMTPFEIKYDISINNYPFSSEDSRLALENVFSFPEELPDDPGERKFDLKPPIAGLEFPRSERTIGYDIESASMFYSWATNVTVDGEEHNVTAEYSGSVSGGEQMIERITFVYPRGESILHDPKIGVADLMEFAGDTADFIELLVSWSTGLGFGVVLVALVAVRLRPSKFDWED